MYLREFAKRAFSALQAQTRVLKIWIHQEYVLYYVSCEQQRRWLDFSDGQAAFVVRT